MKQEDDYLSSVNLITCNELCEVAYMKSHFKDLRFHYANLVFDLVSFLVFTVHVLAFTTSQIALYLCGPAASTETVHHSRRGYNPMNWSEELTLPGLICWAVRRLEAIDGQTVDPKKFPFKSIDGNYVLPSENGGTPRDVRKVRS